MDSCIEICSFVFCICCVLCVDVVMLGFWFLGCWLFFWKLFLCIWFVVCCFCVIVFGYGRNNVLIRFYCYYGFCVCRGCCVLLGCSWLLVVSVLVIVLCYLLLMMGFVVVMGVVVISYYCCCGFYCGIGSWGEYWFYYVGRWWFVLVCLLVLVVELFCGCG